MTMGTLCTNIIQADKSSFSPTLWHRKSISLKPYIKVLFLFLFFILFLMFQTLAPLLLRKNKCSNRSMEVLFPNCVKYYKQPTDRPTDEHKRSEGSYSSNNVWYLTDQKLWFLDYFWKCSCISTIPNPSQKQCSTLKYQSCQILMDYFLNILTSSILMSVHLSVLAVSRAPQKPKLFKVRFR